MSHYRKKEITSGFFRHNEWLTWKKVLLEEAIFNMEKTVATATPLES